MLTRDIVGQAVNDRWQWEFFAGKTNRDAETSGELTDLWVRGDVSAAKPLLTWNNHTGVTTMTWVPALKKFITCISTPSFVSHPLRYGGTVYRQLLVTYLSRGGGIICVVALDQQAV